MNKDKRILKLIASALPAIIARAGVVVGDGTVPDFLLTDEQKQYIAAEAVEIALAINDMISDEATA